jgi:hypothetical protein
MNSTRRMKERRGSKKKRAPIPGVDGWRELEVPPDSEFTIYVRDEPQPQDCEHEYASPRWTH